MGGYGLRALAGEAAQPGEDCDFAGVEAVGQPKRFQECLRYRMLRYHRVHQDRERQGVDRAFMAFTQLVEGGRLPSRHAGHERVIRMELGVDGMYGQGIPRWMDDSPLGSRCEEPAGDGQVTGGTGGKMLPKGGCRHLQEVAGFDPAS